MIPATYTQKGTDTIKCITCGNPVEVHADREDGDNPSLRTDRDIIVRFTFDPTDGWLADVLQRQEDATARLGDKIQDAATTAAFAIGSYQRKERREELHDF